MAGRLGNVIYALCFGIGFLTLLMGSYAAFMSPRWTRTDEITVVVIGILIAAFGWACRYFLSGNKSLGLY